MGNESKFKPRMCWAILFGACAMFFFVYGLPSTFKLARIVFIDGPRTKAWKTTKGKPTWTTKSSVSNTRKSGSGITVYYYCQYLYEVGGKRYEASQFQLGSSNPPRSMSKGGLTQLRERLEDGNGKVTVYYDPDSPSEAVLIAGATGSHVFWLFFWPIVYLMAFSAFGWTAHRHFRKPAEPDGSALSIDTRKPRTRQRTTRRNVAR